MQLRKQGDLGCQLFFKSCKDKIGKDGKANAKAAKIIIIRVNSVGIKPGKERSAESELGAVRIGDAVF